MPRQKTNSRKPSSTLYRGTSEKRGGISMFYEVVESRPYLGTWHAEAVDDERRVFVAIFSGPEAEQRAREYATWKNASRRETATAGSAR